MTPQALSALVGTDQVHRDIYLSPKMFDLEMQRLWPRAWLYVGHTSQLPRAGDAITVQLGHQPVLMLRRDDGGIGVLHNRCAHKGAPLLTEASANVGRSLRCAYHGWSYRLDGSLLGQPMKAGYVGTAFAQSAAAQGLTAYGEVAVYRGFVFACAARRGGAVAGAVAGTSSANAACAVASNDAANGAPSFEDSLGPLLPTLDLLAERSPQGELQIAGGVIRTVVKANWKIYLENINDAVHPVSTHASANLAAQAVWAAQAPGTALSAAMQQLLPFGSGYDFFERMGARLLPHGHSVLGTQHSLHSAYADIAGYAQALQAAHGAQRAAEVLAFAPQNVVAYPSLALKGAPSVLRVIRPLAVDRTLIEAWAFQPLGAPDQLLADALLYNRQVFAPTSPVAHDDLQIFEGIQRSLACQGNPWISLHRGATKLAPTQTDLPRDVSGVDEALLRHQYQAWLKFMGSGL